MDNDKKNLDELFRYGNKILSELKSATEEKSVEINNLNRRHEDFRQSLKNLLDDDAPKGGKNFGR